jgi:hypothetical protein
MLGGAGGRRVAPSNEGTSWGKRLGLFYCEYSKGGPWLLSQTQEPESPTPFSKRSEDRKK